MNFLNQLEFSLSGNFNSNDVLGKVKMFDQIASMTEEAKQEAIKKRMDYERRRSVFEKRKRSAKPSLAHPRTDFQSCTVTYCCQQFKKMNTFENQDGEVQTEK